MVDHANVEAMTLMLLKRNDFTAADRALLILPLFHVNAIMLSVVVPLAAGASTYIADRFDAHAFWPWWKPNGRRTSRASRPSTSSSRCCRTTSGPTLRRCAWACAVPPRCRPTPSCANPIDDRRPGTVGLPFPGVDLAVVDDDGSPVPPGIDGEIVARGPNVMRGYLGRPTETGDALRGGWLHTGDVGHLDTDGYLVIVDRKKDLILRGGENISPSEVPRAIHEIDELPRNAVGKVTKDVLRQRVAAPR